MLWSHKQKGQSWVFSLLTTVHDWTEIEGLAWTNHFCILKVLNPQYFSYRAILCGHIKVKASLKRRLAIFMDASKSCRDICWCRIQTNYDSSLNEHEKCRQVKNSGLIYKLQHFSTLHFFSLQTWLVFFAPYLGHRPHSPSSSNPWEGLIDAIPNLIWLKLWKGKNDGYANHFKHILCLMQDKLSRGYNS